MTNSHLFPARKKDRWGYIDSVGREVIPFRFAKAHEFTDGLARVEFDGDDACTTVYIDNRGEHAIVGPPEECTLDPLFDHWTFDDFHEGYARLWVHDTSGGSSGYIDSKGRLAIPVRFQDADNFSEGMAAVAVHRLRGMGYIDTLGEFVIAPDPSRVSAGEFCGGYACFMEHDEEDRARHGFICPDGEVVVPCVYDDASDRMSEGVAWVTKYDRGKRRTGYVDSKGLEVVPLEFDQLTLLSSRGQAFARQQNDTMIISRDGSIISRLNWDSSQGVLGEFSEGLIRYYKATPKGKRYGFADDDGNIRISAEFGWVSPFHNGLATVTKGSLTCYINHDGEIVFCWATPVRESLR